MHPPDNGANVPDLSGRRAGHGRRPPVTPRARRIGVWLAWWVLLMSFWVVLDDSLTTAELLGGAAAAAVGALVAELAGHQADTRISMRIEWLGPAVRLPAEVARDTGIVFAALWRRLVRGAEPASEFREVPVRFGSKTVQGKTRRALLVGGTSLAPNTLALGLDAERNVMIVHRLVPADEGDTR
jgi:multisubunit Na+/H+ antiporter MnhE subunit